MMAADHFLINPNPQIRTIQMGEERNIVIIVDDFLATPDIMLHHAIAGDAFLPLPGDYYPGPRKATPHEYARNLLDFINREIVNIQSSGPKTSAIAISSAFSIVSCNAENLTPAQSIPHYDTPHDNQLAVVHYLCHPPFGGTSFYRHRSTSFERITTSRTPDYHASLLRDTEIYGPPPTGYIHGDTEIFEHIATVECRFNRAIFYHSNILHSGQIDPTIPHPNDPRTGRLTTSSFIKLVYS